MHIHADARTHTRRHIHSSSVVITVGPSKEQIYPNQIQSNTSI